MFAHVGGVPVEELVPLALVSGGMLASALHRLRSRVRGLRDANRIVYVWGDDRTKSWRDFTTRVRALDF